MHCPGIDACSLSVEVEQSDKQK